MSMFKDREATALRAPWSLEDYVRWQGGQDERDEAEREAANIRILQRFEPETEAAVRVAEEGWCQERR